MTVVYQATMLREVNSHRLSGHNNMDVAHGNMDIPPFEMLPPCTSGLSLVVPPSEDLP